MAMTSRTVYAAVLSAATGLVACGSSVPPPNDQWAAAQADVGRAQSAGAREVPSARLHLQLAQEDLLQARRLMGDDNARARSLSVVACTEAELALSLAREAGAEDRARQAQAALQKGGER
jgi:hypothetical protein